MLFKVFVESIFWTFMLQIFFFLLDMFSKTNFSDATFTLFGFIIIYIAMFVWLASSDTRIKKNKCHGVDFELSISAE